MKITLNISTAGAEEIRDIVNAYISGSRLNDGEIDTAMTVLSTILAKLPTPKKP